MDHSQLNDMGIFLLEKNCYRQAFDKFQDALRSVEQEFDAVKESSQNHCAIEEASLEPFPYPVATNCLPIQLQDLKTVNDTLELLQDGNGQPVDTTVTTVTIRLTGSEPLFTTEELKILIQATVMYNLAVAHEKFAKALRSHRRPLLSNIHQQEAKKFFRLADTLLKRACSSATTTTGEMTNDIQSRFLAMRMLALLGLYSQVAGTSSAKKIEKKLCRVHSKSWALYRREQEQESCCFQHSSSSLVTPAALVKLIE